jgi:hypothetical protein
MEEGQSEQPAIVQTTEQNKSILDPSPKPEVPTQQKEPSLLKRVYRSIMGGGTSSALKDQPSAATSPVSAETSQSATRSVAESPLTVEPATRQPETGLLGKLQANANEELAKGNTRDISTPSETPKQPLDNFSLSASTPTPADKMREYPVVSQPTSLGEMPGASTNPNAAATATFASREKVS